MNERIRELEKQAEEYADSTCLGFAAWRSAQLNKFAELIVKECMTMSDELKAQYLTSRKSTMDFDEKNIYAEGEAACDVLKYKMKKHFGVEE
jgi:hypothetical protein